jgi:hypothetical protein
MTSLGIFFLAVTCAGIIFLYLLRLDKGLKDKHQ